MAKYLNSMLEVQECDLTISSGEEGCDEDLISKKSNRITPKLSNHQYAWQSQSVITFKITAYTIQKFIELIQDDMIADVEKYSEIQYDYDKQTSYISRGEIKFIYNNKLYNYKANINSLNNTLVCYNHEITDILELIKAYLESNNPLKNKCVYLQGDFENYSLKLPPDVSFDDVILNIKLKEDIYDQTIYQLKHIEGTNGIIFYGVPGSGKSMTCQAIINEALKEGFSCCYITSVINYGMLDEFLKLYLVPCIVIFEDIDSFAQSREQSSNFNLSNFLQFMSGIAEKKDKMVFIATTNYLEHLDKAIANRPARFNRKFEFKLPTQDYINLLIDKYFGEGVISQELKKYCYSQKTLTGSHVAELYRTCKLLSHKRNVMMSDVFIEATQLIKDNFSTTIKEIGFGNTN